MSDQIDVAGEVWTLPAFVAQADDHPSACRSCGAAILWVRTVSGARAPLDRDGKSHFATCPQAEQWRRKR